MHALVVLLWLNKSVFHDSGWTFIEEKKTLLVWFVHKITFLLSRLFTLIQDWFGGRRALSLTWGSIGCPRDSLWIPRRCKRFSIFELTFNSACFHRKMVFVSCWSCCGRNRLQIHKSTVNSVCHPLSHVITLTLVEFVVAYLVLKSKLLVLTDNKSDWFLFCCFKSSYFVLWVSMSVSFTSSL